MDRKHEIPRSSITHNPRESDPSDVANDYWSGDPPPVVPRSSSRAKARFRDLKLLPQIRSDWTTDTIVQWLEIYGICAHERRRKIIDSSDSYRQTGATQKGLRILVAKFGVSADADAIKKHVWRARQLVQRGFEIDDDTISDCLEILPEEAAKLSILKAARKYR